MTQAAEARRWRLKATLTHGLRCADAWLAGLKAGGASWMACFAVWKWCMNDAVAAQLRSELELELAHRQGQVTQRKMHECQMLLELTGPTK